MATISKYAKQIERIQTDIDNGTFMRHASDYNSHSKMHMQMNDVDMLQRVLVDTKANSTFESKEKADYFIQELMYNNNTLEKIYTACERLDIKNEGNYTSYNKNEKYHYKDDVRIDMAAEGYDEEPIGTGFAVDTTNNTIREYETQGLVIVFQKQEISKGNPYGFTILTAYPDMTLDTKDMTPTNRDLREIVKQTNEYKESSAVKSTYMLYQTNPNNEQLLTFRPGDNIQSHDDALFVHIPVSDATETTPKIEHIIKIKESGSTLYTKCGNKKLDTEFSALIPKHVANRQVANLYNMDVKSLFAAKYPEINEIVKDLQRTINLEVANRNAILSLNTISYSKPVTNQKPISVQEQRTKDLNAKMANIEANQTTETLQYQ